MTDGVSFPAILTRLTSTADGGWNITFSVSEDRLDEVRALMSFKDRLTQVGCILIQDLVNESEWQDPD